MKSLKFIFAVVVLFLYSCPSDDFIEEDSVITCYL